MNHLETWRTFLKTEKGRQPRTITEYSNDLKQFSQFMDSSQPAWNWSEVTTLSIRSFLAALEQPSPHRVHRLVLGLTLEERSSVAPQFCFGVGVLPQPRFM